MAAPSYRIVGVNTGNSLDAADVVLTEFAAGSQRDLAFESYTFPENLKADLRKLRSAVEAHKGDVAAAIKESGGEANGAAVIEAYTRFVGEAVRSFVKEKAGDRVDAIGFHGQTCAHFPPAVARKHDREPYTVQVGDGQLLADIVGVPVVYDFRSDDVMLGGEGAPLAPVHHQHLAEVTKRNGCFPIAFCNAGNTGNVSIISGTAEKTLPTMGWDNGPFNDYPDLLCRLERNASCDEDSKWGKQGRVNESLLRLLFEKGATTDSGENFLLIPPPKSSDPQWYRRLPELLGKAPVDGKVLSFEDRLRTAEYFAAYVFAFGLSNVPAAYPMPGHFALCGGGWKNTVIREHFTDLLQGRFDRSPVLPEHRALFEEIRRRVGPDVQVKFSSEYGFDGQAMEARIFADAALSRLSGKPFSFPETTGVSRPALLGIIRFPFGKTEAAGAAAMELLQKHDMLTATPDGPAFDARWGRAAAGWKARLAAAKP